MRRSISVIIPTNRGGPYLVDAVASVRAQTVPVTEIIVVDDGSAGDAVERFTAAEQLRYLRLSGVGVSAARNAGAAAARGDWLIFLDDDDIWHPERIAAQMQALDAQPDAVASHTGGWHMDAQGARFGTDWTAPSAPATDLLRGRVPTPRITTLVVRHDLFNRIGGFDTGMRMSEDNDLVMRIVMQGEFAAVDRPLVGYRRHAGNTTATRTLDGRIGGRMVYRKARRTADREQRIALREGWHRFCRATAEENLRDLVAALRAHEWRHALRCVTWGARTAPRQALTAAVRLLRARRRSGGAGG